MKIENSGKFNYEWCKDVFELNDKVPTAFTSSNHTRVACLSSSDIYRTANHFLKLEILKGQYSPEVIRHCIVSSLKISDLYPSSDFGDDKSKKEFIDALLLQYMRYKLNYIAKTVSVQQFQDNMRRRLTRLIINQHQ